MGAQKRTTKKTTPEAYGPQYDPLNPGQIAPTDPSPPTPIPAPNPGGSKGGDGDEPLVGLTSTDKTVDLENSRTYFNDGIGDK